MTQAKPRFLIIGNPDNRRVTRFEKALHDEGFPRPLIFSHLSLLEQPDRLLDISDDALVVRIDALGEDWTVQSRLLQLGQPAAEQQGRCQIASCREIEDRDAWEVLAPRQAHFGLLSYLHMLERRFNARPTWRQLAPTGEIACLFDKHATARRIEQLGVAVPPALPAGVDSAALQQELTARNWPSVFIKLTCGSSASGLAVFRHRASRVTVFTTLLRQRGRWFNSLRVQRLESAQAVETTLRFLFAEGARVEKEVPKAKQAGRFGDLRVLTIAGHPEFVVLRQNHHPITNLHLGGTRGDVDRLRTRMGDASWSRLLATCRQLAAGFRSHQLGLDVAIGPDLKTHWVIEANAFGDLLPGLVHRGRSVYQTQLARL